MALDFLAIQSRNTSEKMISPIATIMEMTTGLENIVLLLYSYFIAARSENRWKNHEIDRVSANAIMFPTVQKATRDLLSCTVKRGFCDVIG